MAITHAHYSRTRIKTFRLPGQSTPVLPAKPPWPAPLGDDLSI